MKMTCSMKLTVVMAATFGLAAAALADTVALPPASTKPGVTYATDIKPLLDANCAKCHSGDRPKARLKLDTLEGALAGNREGKVINSGDSSNSFIVKVIAHATSDKDSWMPPMPNRAGAKTLTSDEIGLIRAWIDQGAK
jgi:mono/diheme cytochrome c family protein